MSPDKHQVANPDSTLFITKSRATHGAHRITSSLIRGLLDTDTPVHVLAWEHPEETSRWQIGSLWDELADVTEVVTPALKCAKPNESENTFTFLDQLLLNDNKIQERMRELAPQFGRVVIDSWYVAQSAYRADIHKLHNSVQLTQSRPEFLPEAPEKVWKAQLFSLLPKIDIPRIFTCKTYMNEYINQENNQYIGVYVDETFLNTHHVPKEVDNKGLNLVTVTSTPAIPEKGIKELLINIDKALSEGVNINRLTIVSGQPLPDYGYLPNIDIKFVHNPDRTTHANILAESDAYVTFTRQETPGLAQLEALAVGLPCLAVDSGGNNDYFTGDNFIMFNGTEDFISSLMSMHNINFRRSLSENARKSSAFFTESAMQERFRSALNKHVKHTIHSM